MFELIYSGKVYPDYTHTFDVLVDRQYTVKEFITEMLETRGMDWGIITVRQGYKKRNGEYSRGYITETIKDIDGNSIIKEIHASGCFSNINYVIDI